MRRSRRQNLTTLPGLVAAGRLLPVQPTTDSGYRSYSAGRLFLPAGTNLATDPQGTAQTFWPADGTHNDLTPNQSLPVPLPDQPLITKCIKLTNDGTAESSQTANMTVSASTSYMTTLYVYAPTLGGNLVITGETGTTSTVATLTGANTGWVRYAAATNTGVGQTTLALKFAFAGGTASTVYVTGVCPYAGTVTMPYFDGGYPGCAWSGTANASTSTRTASVLQFTDPFASNASFTVAMKYTPLFTGSIGATAYLLRTSDATNRYDFFTGYGSFTLRAHDAGGDTVISTAGTPSAGVAASLVARVSSTTLDVDKDGTSATQVANARTAPATTSTIEIGNVDGGSQGRGYYGPILISPTRISDADVTNFQTNRASLWSDPIALYRWLSGHGYTQSLILPLQSDSVGYLVRS